MLVMLTCIGLNGCISLTKKCDCNFGLDYQLSDSTELAADPAIPYSIGIGNITITDQYNHTFLTERGINGRLIPHEENCWLEQLNVMTADVLRDYLLDRIARTPGVQSIEKSGYPQYTIDGRILELSALKSGEVTVRMEVRVTEGDPSGRVRKVVLARVFEITPGDKSPPFNTRGDFRNIPLQFSRALVELGRRIVSELDKERQKKDEPPQPATPAETKFVLAGTDAKGRRHDLTIQLNAAEQNDKSGTGNLIFRNQNGEEITISITQVFKSNNGLGLKFLAENMSVPDAINVTITSSGCSITSTTVGDKLPESIPCICETAHAFLAWRRALKLGTEQLPATKILQKRDRKAK